MKLYIKITRGDKETLIIEADPTDTIGKIQNLIFEKTQIPPDEQRVIYQGKTLEYNRTLSEYNMPDESTLYVTLNGAICFCYIRYGEQKLRVSRFCSCCSNTLFLKQHAQGFAGVPLKDIELVVNGQVMEDDKNLAYYGIPGNDIELRIKK